MAYYLDTSAAVKLVVSERSSRATTTWARTHADEVVSSDLLRTELRRATRRGAPAQMPRARAVLDAITLLSVPAATFERAAELEPLALRSLHAVHLAAALELGDELDGIVTYDVRLSSVARNDGIAVVTPS